MFDGSVPLTVSRVAAVIRRAGYDAAIEWEADFIVVRTRPLDYFITAYLYTDEAHSDCPMLDNEPCISLQFSSNWRIAPEQEVAPLTQLCNLFNSENRFAKAYVLVMQDYRSMSLEHTVYAGDGIADESIVGLYKHFIDSSSKFMEMWK